MKTIVPLRALSIGSNIVFICYALLGIHYGIFDKVLPILVLHLALLPLNIYRLRQITETIRSVQMMEQSSSANDFLIPFIDKKTYADGTVLFKKGADARDVYLISKGQIAVSEVDKWLAPGMMFGEVAVFSSGAKRTAMTVCQGDCEICCMTGFKMLELFYLDQRFAFKIARSFSNYAVSKYPTPPAQPSDTTAISAS